MKKWHVVAIVLLICGILIALYFGGFIPTPSEEPNFSEDAREVIPTMETQESTPEHFVGILHIPSLAASKIKVNGVLYHKLSLLGSGSTGEEGKPDIPFLVYHFLLPTDEQGQSPVPDVQLEMGDVAEFKHVTAYPVQPMVPENISAEPPHFTIDEQAYQSKSAYPGKSHETKLIKVGEVNLLLLRIYPIEYIPGNRLLRLHREVSIDLNFNPQHATVSPVSMLNDMHYIPAIPPPENEDTIQSIPVVLEGHPMQIYDDPFYSFLIIAHQDLYSAAYRLAEHKKEMGWRVKLASTADVQPSGYYNPTLHDAIKNFVREEWDKNRLLSTRMDSDDPSIPNDQDIRGMNIIRKHDMMYVEVVLWEGVTNSPLLYVYFDIDGDGVADRTISTLNHDFHIYEKTTEPPLYSGTAIVQGRLISVSFPWSSAFPPSGTDAQAWAVCELEDRIPDEGTAPADWNGGLHGLRFLLLMGDADRIRPNLGLNEGLKVLGEDNPKGLTVGTDLYYAIVQDKDDYYPDISIGRIPVDNLTEANAVVDKIIAYETTSAPARFSHSFSVMGGFYDVEKFKPDTERGGTLEGTMSFSQMSTDVAGAGTSFRSQVRSGDWIRIWNSRRDFVQVDRVIDDHTIRLASPYSDTDIAGTWELWRIDGRDNSIFINTAERVRDYLVGDLGYTGDRVYTADWGRVDPRWFDDGRDLPMELRRPSYPWDADNSDVVNVLNSGDHLFILHRDHGGFFGWGLPGIGSSYIVNNAHSTSPLLPVVFSINCASGYFDNEYDYWRIWHPGGTFTTVPAKPETGADWSSDDSLNFAEALIRQPDGGAIGVIAATRLSYSWRNDIFTDGIISYMYSGYTGRVRGTIYAAAGTYLGDILKYAKMYAGGRLSDDDWVHYYMELWHVIGDPTLDVKVA